MIPEIKEQIEKLQKPQATKDKERTDNENRDEDRDAPDSSANQASVTQRLNQLERLVQEMNDRLKSIEAHLSSAQSN
jgi:uncharacterized FlaG/YvyC family protein